MVYTAESPAAALLEICAHTSADDLPPSFTLLKIEGPDIAMSEIEPGELPRDWAQQMELRPLALMLKLKKIHILGFKSFCDRTELACRGRALPWWWGRMDAASPTFWTG
jgi:hypothetical protein